MQSFSASRMTSRALERDDGDLRSLGIPGASVLPLRGRRRAHSLRMVEPTAIVSCHSSRANRRSSAALRKLVDNQFLEFQWESIEGPYEGTSSRVRADATVAGPGPFRSASFEQMAVADDDQRANGPQNPELHFSKSMSRQ
jgi:hypothetical protein